MPATSDVAFVVVQHLDPKHHSMAAQLLGKLTAMAVDEATDGAMLERNHVYTAPSDKDVAVVGGRLRLSSRAVMRGVHLPIDHFFSSLGDAYGERAIGIVLSGTGSDGSLGASAIAANGGIVLVQDPQGAQFDGMPRSAIATGMASHVLPVEQMPRLIAAYARHPYVATGADVLIDDSAAQAIQTLLKIVQARHGYDFSSYKRSTLLRRMQRRMGLRGIVKQTDYVRLLKNDAAEVDALFYDFLIGVTQFFRDPEAWKALDTDVIAPMVEGKPPGEPIRIWIPGCSTGQEAYSMAMVVLDRLRRIRKRCPVQIFATDTNNAALEVGRLGRYPAGIAGQVSALRLRRYFTAQASTQHYDVSEELRACVVFGTQNMFADPPFGRVDLISCRNVLIYLEPEMQKRVLGIFHFALRRGGHLFLGNAESNGGRDDQFLPVSRKWRIYLRQGSGRGDLQALPLLAADARIGLVPAPLRPPSTTMQVAALAQKLILDRFAPASVLVNARNETLYFCGPTDDFLLRPRGAPTQDLLVLVREGLRSRVRAALQEAAKTGLPADVPDARMKHGGAFVPVQITVTPLRETELGPMFLVVLRPASFAIGATPDKGGNRSLVRHLEEELLATRDDLQNTIERFESANEELRISNEEVVTSNEELRSLNEELESSKEELQSLNEELTTVNQQLQVKVCELEVSNSDLHNLLASSDIATICLDRALRVKWFAPAAQRQFNLIAGDVGRPISDIMSALGDAGLVASARAVLATQSPTAHEFQTETGRWYVRRALPYKNGEARVSGVIVTYTDITDARLAAEATRLARGDLADSRETTFKLRQLSAALALAEERERRVLAKDLHDDLGQMLAVIAIKAAVMQKLDLPAPLRLAVQECMKAVELTNQKLRSMALRLNPPMLDRLGFVEALHWLADEMHRVYALDVNVEDDGAPKPLDAGVSATLFRAVQELLRNVCQHARVNVATVSLARGAGNTMSVTVADAGAGFDSDDVLLRNGESSWGLVGMRERLGLLGCDVKVHSVPGDGTAVALRVPLMLSLPPPRAKVAP